MAHDAGSVPGAGDAIELPQDFYDRGPDPEPAAVALPSPSLARAAPQTGAATDASSSECNEQPQPSPTSVTASSTAAAPPATHSPADLSSGATSDAANADAGHTAPDMEAVFADLRRRLDRLRHFNMANRESAARREAAAILSAAAGAGCKRIASRAARLLLPSTKANREAAGRYLSAGALDEVEVQLDAAEALWRSCRVVV